MVWDRNLINLRNILASLYWEPVEARRVAMEAGLDPNHIHIAGKPINVWHAILERAYHLQKVGKLIWVALDEYPAHEGLLLAQDGRLGDAVETPPLQEGEWRGPTVPQLEKILGAVSTLRPISFLQKGVVASRSVGRIVCADGSRGTGFLTTGNLLITNHHVLRSERVAARAVVEFNCEQTVEGRDATVRAYRLDPDRGFATSPVDTEGGDDWTAVRVKDAPNNEWGALPLDTANPQVDDEAIIIQHPYGQSKQIALSHNKVVYVNPRRVQYLTDTAQGSSGAPVFNPTWQVIALHHSGGNREPGARWSAFRNQGVHVNVVVEGVRAAGLL